jgi:hypothetical protein
MQYGYNVNNVLFKLELRLKHAIFLCTISVTERAAS